MDAVVADEPVPGIMGSDHIEYYGGHCIAESVAPQNCPLIVAAPDLLAAAKAALDVLVPNADVPGDLTRAAADKVRAAIAKAEGR